MSGNKKRKPALSAVLVILLITALVLIFIYTPVTQSEQIDLEELALPYYSEGEIIKHAGFTLSYAEEFEQPWWVAYVLTPWETVTKAVSREDSFKPDSAVSTGSAQLSDYKKSGYDRGHMAPFADLSWSEESASDSFYLSNMSPQAAALNRGAWADLEATVRTFSLSGPVCVITGPVLSGGPYKTIGENKVAVPDYYYKIIYSSTLDSAIAFLMPNEKCEKPLQEYVVSVDYVEELTGIDFLYLLPDEYENRIEDQSEAQKWDFSEYSSSVALRYGCDGTQNSTEIRSDNVQYAEISPDLYLKNILYKYYKTFVSSLF